MSEGRHTHGGVECDKHPPGPTPWPERRESGSQKLAESPVHIRCSLSDFSSLILQENSSRAALSHPCPMTQSARSWGHPLKGGLGAPESCCELHRALELRGKVSLLSTCCVSCTTLNSSVFLVTCDVGTVSHHPHFTDEETKAQTDAVASPVWRDLAGVRLRSVGLPEGARSHPSSSAQPTASPRRGGHAQSGSPPCALLVRSRARDGLTSLRPRAVPVSLPSSPMHYEDQTCSLLWAADGFSAPWFMLQILNYS